MNRWLNNLYLLGIILLLFACGTGGPTSGGTWKPIKTINGKEIIAELIQTTENTTIRDQEAEKIKQGDELGEVTPEFEDDIVYQRIEASATLQEIDRVYGENSGLYQEGIIFMENKESGAKNPGIWIGLKNPDQRLTKIVENLQRKVDSGEILAKYIYFYKTDFSQSDLDTLNENVSAKMAEFAKKHEKPQQVSWMASVDPITGKIEIGHDFLTDQNIMELKNAYPTYELNIVQNGRMVPVGDEPDTVYSDEKFVNEPSKEGFYIVDVNDTGMMVVAATAEDFSSTGGVEEYFEAISYSFPKANEKLKVGQRVLIEDTGFIMESYPAQGTAKFVEVLPEYKPKSADLSESDVISVAVKIANEKSNWVPAIRDLQYNNEKDIWIVNIKQEDLKYEVEIKDE